MPEESQEKTDKAPEGQEQKEKPPEGATQEDKKEEGQEQKEKPTEEKTQEEKKEETPTEEKEEKPPEDSLVVDESELAKEEKKEPPKELYTQLERDELHRKIGGYVPKGSLLLFEGKDGFGKSILSQRLMYSFLQHGSTVTYISTELSTKDFIEQMDSVDYDISDYMINEKLLFIPIFPFIGGVTLKSDFINRLLGARKLFQTDCVIIDTFSFLLVKDNITEAETFDVVKFFKKIADSGKTIIFTADPDHLNQELLTLLRSVADVYFELTTMALAGEVKRYINVNRYKRAPPDVSARVAFTVDAGSGINIDISAMA
ncbi:ATPase domain-containing protein [Candidatus Altiarchaeota archaeon]